MSLTFVQQPPNSSLCGQCCVAMITGRKLEEVIRTMGTEGGTRTRDVVDALLVFDVDCELELETLKRGQSPPPLCMAKCHIFSDTKRWTHWIVIKDGIAYCPGHRAPFGPWMVYDAYCGRVTSFLRINS